MKEKASQEISQEYFLVLFVLLSVLGATTAEPSLIRATSSGLPDIYLSHRNHRLHRKKHKSIS
jgi:hypothetical protein